LGISLLSKDGLTWELKQEVSMTADEKVSLGTLEPINLSIVTNQMELSGALIISVNGSTYDEVIIDKSNFNMGVIRVPSFILNDGTHDIQIKLSDSGKFISNDINIKATVGTPKETIYHRVKMGETLESIASQYETTPAWIREANGLNANEPIERSMKLKVKYIYNSNMLSTSPIYEQYHVVLPGQGLAKIASINEVTVSQIKKLNNIKEEEIYVGQRIRIA
jgi:LysM repeat protein